MSEGGNSNKVLYQQFCESNPVAIFSQSWWLDAACGKDNWNVALAKKKDRIVGSLPYEIRRCRMHTVSNMPALTQTLGPYIAYPPKQRYQKKLAFEKDVCEMLIAELPPLDQFSQNFSPEFQNWLPFHWNGYKQTTRYTYVLDGIKDHDSVWKNLSGNIRSDVRKAEKTVRVVEEANSDELYALVTKTFQRQGKKTATYSSEFLHRIVAACQKNNCCKMFLAVDEDGRHHAGALVVWDESKAFYLVGGGDPDLRNSGATSLVVWHSIKEASKHVDCFDFEGSMLEPVERFFRAFGARQQLIFRVSKTNSRMMKFQEFGKSLIRG